MRPGWRRSPWNGTGREIVRWIDVYRHFYGFYFSNAYAFDPTLYAWCLRQLGRSGGSQ